MVNFELLYDDLKSVLEIKKEDFYTAGVKTNTEAIWQFCVQTLWQKNQKEELHVAQMVADLFQLTPLQFSTTPIEQRKSINWRTPLIEAEIHSLLKE